jgi:hypothetical protein
MDNDAILSIAGATDLERATDDSWLGRALRRKSGLFKNHNRICKKPQPQSSAVFVYRKPEVQRTDRYRVHRRGPAHRAHPKIEAPRDGPGKKRSDREPKGAVDATDPFTTDGKHDVAGLALEERAERADGSEANGCPCGVDDLTKNDGTPRRIHAARGRVLATTNDKKCCDEIVGSRWRFHLSPHSVYGCAGEGIPCSDPNGSRRGVS